MRLEPPSCVFDHVPLHLGSNRRRHKIPPVGLETVPEHGDGIKDFMGALLEEPRLVEPGGERRPPQALFHGMTRVLGFDAVMPREKGDFECGQPRCLDLEQAVFQFLPEPSSSPVLDARSSPLRRSGRLRCQRAAEARRRSEGRKNGRRCLRRFPRSSRSQARAFRGRRQAAIQEVGGAEPEQTAVDGSFGADQVGVALSFFGFLGNVSSGCSVAASFRR